MRLLFLDQYGELGGAQRCLLDLLPGVRDRGWTGVVAAPGDGGLLEKSREAGALVEQLQQPKLHSGEKSPGDLWRFGFETPRLARRIRALLRRHRIEALYVNGPRLLPAAALAQLEDTAVFFHAHSYLAKKYSATLAGLALRRAAGTLIASCEFVSGPLRPYVPGGRVHVVYSGVPDCAAPRSRSGSFHIGVIGRIAPEKGQAEFVEAARLVLGAHPRCRFSVYGAALFGDSRALRYQERLGRLAAGLPVELAGWREDVPSLLAGLDLLVAPSQAPEATTRVILEAYSARVPVVATRVGGIPEVVEDGRTGFLADSGASSLAARINDVLALPAGQLQSVVEAGRKLFEERFSLDRYRQRVLDLVERAVRQQPAQQ